MPKITVKTLTVCLLMSLLSGCFELVDKVEPTNTLAASPPMFPIAANEPPAISGNPGSNAAVGRPWSFTPSAFDPDGDPISFFIENQPDWANFNVANGTLSGVPLLGDVGETADITISVYDGSMSKALSSFSITVLNSSSNTPPSISGTPVTNISVGQNYNFAPTANDPESDSLFFDIANRPGWATFDNGTGILSGIPTASDARVYSNIVISVRDAQLSASLPPFTINVQGLAASNQPPQISGTPTPSGTVDQPYLFAPIASDPDGDNLTFMIDNLPSWANFNAASGELSGTPAPGHEAVYSDILISVDDGELRTSLPRFTITVSQSATGSVTLTWTAPTTNTDGSTLTDLAAYKIYYGTTQGNYPNEIRIDNTGMTTYVIENLGANTYYFVSTSINQQEIESGYSNVATKTIN